MLARVVAAAVVPRSADVAARNARDFSADSGSDILLQQDSGLPAIWTMDGTTPTGSDWHLV